MSDSAPADPVIVIGAPRSGVGLLAALLDAHPRLASGPDLPCLITILRQWRELERSLGASHSRHFGLQPSRRRSAFRAAIESLLRPRLQLTGKRRFVIQTFAGVVCPELFQELFPQARFVLVLRDPRDVTASLMRCDWRVSGQSARLPCTTSAQRAAAQWLESIRIALQRSRSLLATGRMFVLRYEDLCRAPTTALGQLGRFLGESAPSPCVTVESAALVTASLHNPNPPLRTGRITGESVGRWTRELDEVDLAVIERIGGHVMAGLGYTAAARSGRSLHQRSIRFVS